THFLLTNEVRKPDDLEHTDFLLGSHPNAAIALDLLLGTQGWRRFAEQNPVKFRQEQKDEADRLLVMEGIVTPALAPQAVELARRNLDKVSGDFNAKIQAKQLELSAAEANLQAVKHDQQFQDTSAELKKTAAVLQGTLTTEQQTLNTYKELAR